MLANLKVTPDRVLFIALIIVVAAAGIWIYLLSRQLRSARHDAKVQTVVVQRDKVLNTDSVRMVIERRVQDSAAAVILIYEKQLKTLRNENYQLKNQNAALRDAYNGVDLQRPEY